VDIFREEKKSLLVIDAQIATAPYAILVLINGEKVIANANLGIVSANILRDVHLVANLGL
tara:strand:+ start:762 stop:941 length:180 start_codon:yes stop_codon:yes gene_type:complete